MLQDLESQATCAHLAKMHTLVNIVALGIKDSDTYERRFEYTVPLCHVAFGRAARGLGHASPRINVVSVLLYFSVVSCRRMDK